MLNKLRQYPKTLAFFCGWLCVGALPPFYALPLLWIGFSGLLFLLNAAPSAKAAFARGYAFGFAFFAFGFSWIGNALLIDAAAFGWLYPLAFLACGFFFGLFAAFPALLTFRCFTTVTARWLAFASLWILFEWLRSWLLTGFPWNLLGSALAFSPQLLQFASVLGTYGLSFLLVLAAASPVLYLCRRDRRSLLTTVAITFGGLAFLYLFGLWRLPAAPFPLSDTVIRLVQPAIPQAMKWRRETLENNLREYISLSTAPGLDKVDFTLWGETASPFPLDMDDSHRLQVLPAVPPQGYLVTGLVRYQPLPDGSYRAFNSMLALNPQGTIAATYDKSHLVPFGEYIPLRRWLPDWIRPVANAVGTFAAGTGPRRISLDGQPAFGGLICYEVIFPHRIINQSERPDWLINLTNDGWYGNSAGPYQHLVTTQLRAVEEGITIARAANTGISALISPYGTILGQISLNKRQILDINLPFPTQFSTTYGKYGNLPLFILLISNLGLAFYASSRNF